MTYKVSDSGRLGPSWYIFRDDADSDGWRLRDRGGRRRLFATQEDAQQMADRLNQGADAQLLPAGKYTEPCALPYVRARARDPFGPVVKVRYKAVDHYAETRCFRTLAAARRFAQRYVGAHPEIGRTYAISGDGVGKVMVTGCTLAELFPD